MLKLRSYWFLYPLKLTALLGPFLVTGYLLHNHGLSVLGEYALYNSYAIGISLISRFGFEILIEREASRLNLKDIIRLYSSACIIVIIFTLILSIIVSLTILPTARFGLFTVVFIVGWSMGYSINFLMNAGLRARKYFYLATLFLIGNINFILILLIMMFASFQVDQIFIILGVGPLIVNVLVLVNTSYFTIIMREVFKKILQPLTLDPLKDAIDYSIINIMSFTRNAASFWFLGIFFPIEIVGAFRLITQINTLLNFPIIVSNIFVPQKISHTWSTKNIKEIMYFARAIARRTVLLGSPILLFLMIYHSSIADYLSIETEFITAIFGILVLSQFINLSTGASNALLTMTNQHRTARNNSIFSGVFFMLTFPVLALNFDLFGAVMAFSLAIVIDNVLCLLSVKRNLGFWIFPSNNKEDNCEHS